MDQQPEQRSGLDVEMLQILEEVGQYLSDLRANVEAPVIVDAASAVRRYLLYLSVLIEQLIFDVVLSSVNSLDLMSTMKMRLLIEWTVKARYFRLHPDYALAMTTVQEAAAVLRKLTEAKAPPDRIYAAEARLSKKKNDFPTAAGVVGQTLSAMMAEVNSHARERDDYVWLYGAPSALMHGDPEGMRFVFNGPFDVREANAVLVDLGGNVLFFCNQLREILHPADAAFEALQQTLEYRVKTKIVQHTSGRNEEAVEQVLEEVRGFE